jgi:hypothetical protein
MKWLIRISMMALAVGLYADAPSLNPKGELPAPTFEERIEHEPFRVAETGSAEFPKATLLRIFDRFRHQYSLNATGELKWRAASAFAPGNTVLLTGTIFQSLDGGKFLLKTGETDSGDILVLVQGGDDQEVDGQPAEIYATLTGHYDYANALGSNRRVPLYTVFDLPPEGWEDNGATHEQFVAWLKAGKTFPVYEFYDRDSRQSGGMGWVYGDSMQHQNPDKKYITSDGEPDDPGTERVIRIWNVEWN